MHQNKLSKVGSTVLDSMYRMVVSVAYVKTAINVASHN